MQDPIRDIKEAFVQITAARSQDDQRAGIYKYYVPNAGLHNPLCHIEPRVRSRELVVGLYQWCRVLSPDVSIEITNIVYDEPRNILLLDVTHAFLLPVVHAMPSRLLVRLTLEKGDDNLYRIAFQEDFFHPDDLAALVFPPAASICRLILRAFGTTFHFSAKVAQVLGFWRPRKTGLADDRNDERKCTEEVYWNDKGLEYFVRTAKGLDQDVEHSLEVVETLIATAARENGFGIITIRSDVHNTTKGAPDPNGYHITGDFINATKTGGYTFHYYMDQNYNPRSIEGLGENPTKLEITSRRLKQISGLINSPGRHVTVQGEHHLVVKQGDCNRE